jgi:hypothetical protein
LLSWYGVFIFNGFLLKIFVFYIPSLLKNTMHQYSTSKQVMAGIMLLSHGLMSCLSPNLNKQEFQDHATKLVIHPSNTNPSSSSNKEEIEIQLPSLLQESNDASISINPQFENPSAFGETELETKLQDPYLTDTDVNVVVSEGKREIIQPSVLGGKQSPGAKRASRMQTSMTDLVDDNNNKKKEESKPESKPSNKPDNKETDRSRTDLAVSIMSTTGAEPDIRLNTYYHLASQLEGRLKEDAVLRGEWNALWQKLQEPELLVNRDAYYSGLEHQEEAFGRLEIAIQEIKGFKDQLGVYGLEGLGWQRDLEALASFYEQFREKVIDVWSDPKTFFKVLEPKALLIGEWWPEEYYRIDQTIARHLVGKDESGHRKEEQKKEDTSNHYVSFLPIGSPLEATVYFKNDGMPHLNPSREYMLYSLYKRLDIAIPASGLLVIDHVKFGEKYNEEPFSLQASQAISGIIGKKALKEKVDLNLDIDHFSKQVLGALLSGPVDGKADNYVLTDLPNKKKGLVSIDNDEVFQAPIYRDRVHLKSVLFLLSSMKEVISKSVDLIIRQLPIGLLILEWLDSMRAQERRYQRLKESLIQHSINSKQFRKGGNVVSSRIEALWQELSLPFLNFQSSMIPTVSHLFSKLESCVRERKVVCLWDLFQICYPNISMHYQLLQGKASNDPYEALRLLYDPEENGFDKVLATRLGADGDNNNKGASSEQVYFQEEAQGEKHGMEDRLEAYKEGSEIEMDKAIEYYFSLFRNELGNIDSAIGSLQVLINHGYNLIVDNKTAASLYVKGLVLAKRANREKKWQSIFKYLGEVNPELGWLFTLEEHFPQGWILEGKYQEAKYPQELRGASIGRRHLTKELEAVLLDKEGRFIADKSLSGRLETNFYPKVKPVFYFKKYPELPAYEYGVTSFMRRLGMSQVPRNELFSFYNKEEGLYPVLVSEAIEGEAVYKVWEDDSRFSNLDPIYTSRLLLASMLLNPEDSKEDNFILSSDNKYLIPIDNDHAFLPGAIEAKGTFKVYSQLQTKTLAFCLKEMERPLPSAIVSEFTSINVELFLEAWIKGLVKIQSQYQNLLLVEELGRLWKERGVCMHMPLSPLYIQGLYRKFHLLKTLLIQNPQITPLALLKRLEPYVGSKYEGVMGLPTLKARFQGVSEAYKQSSAKGARMSIANSQRLMEIMEMPDSVLMASPVVFKKGPESALDQLKGLYKDQGLHSNRLRDLLRGPIGETNQLDKESEGQLIRQWFESKEAYDWIMLHESNQLKEKHVSSFSFQNKGHLLSALDLRGAKQLRESSLMALHNYCPNLLYLNISGWPLERLGYFKPSGLLGGLELHQGPIFPSLQRLIIEGCKELKEIDLDLGLVESIEAKDNQALRKLRLKVPCLKYLDISGHQASDPEQVAWFGNLQFNGLPTIKGFTTKAEVIKEALAESDNKLDLHKKSLNAVDILFLVNHPLFKEKKVRYKEISLGDNQIGDKGAAEFAKNLQGTAVQTVGLNNNQIGDKGAAEFAKNLQGTAVQTVNLECNQIGALGAAGFAKNLQGTAVQTVNLSENQIGDKGAVVFAKNLQGTAVHTVHLGSNKIGDLRAAEFAENLQGTSVQTVELWNNQIGDKGAAEFAKNLQGTAVQTIHLGSNQIGDKGAVEFAKNLQGTAVQTVDLRLNQIGDKGAVEFAKNLQGTAVQTINLWNNNIGDSGVAEFAKNLQGTAVQTVYLSRNKIGDKGAAEFAKNLQGTAVQTVKLSWNQIGDKGAVAFAKNLQGTAVQTVDLSRNQIGDKGAVEFAKNLQGTRVQAVYLGSNQIGYETEALLRKTYPHIKWEF